MARDNGVVGAALVSRHLIASKVWAPNMSGCALVDASSLRALDTVCEGPQSPDSWSLEPRTLLAQVSTAPWLEGSASISQRAISGALRCEVAERESRFLGIQQLFQSAAVATRIEQSMRIQRSGTQVAALEIGATVERREEWGVEEPVSDCAYRFLFVNNVARQLDDLGNHYAARHADGVATNFVLTTLFIVDSAARPSFVNDAFSGPSPFSALLYSIAVEGYLYVNALASLFERSGRLRDALESLGLGTRGVGLALEDDWLQIRWLARDRGLQKADIPDSPQRALPRETRAGPSKEDTEDPPLGDGWDAEWVLACRGLPQRGRGDG